jgi:predicted Zn finger-like uncharacterized protein
MKVVCESCQAKYQVPDERVAGKKLKIKCKRCGATVLIRGDLALGAAAHSDILPPASVPPAAVSEAAPLEWHVSRDGETRGPFDTEELRSWLSSEPAGWDVHVWRDGFPDWIDARSCAELGGPLVSEARATFDPHDDDGPTRTFESAAATAAPLMARAAASNRAAHTSSHASHASESRSSSIRTRSPSGISNGGGGRISTVEALTGERHEDSVLFSARGLPSLASSSPSYTPGPNPGFASGEGSGLIDIRALASLARQTAPRIAPGAVAAAALNFNGAAAQSGGYSPANNALSFGDDEDARVALMNQGAFGRIDSLAPVSTGPQTSNVAVPLAIVGGCALVAAAVFAAMLIARPTHPPEPVAVSAPTAQDSDSLGAVAQPPSNPEPSEPSEPPPAAAVAANEEAHPAEAAQEPKAPAAAAQPMAADESGELASGKPKRQPHVPRTIAEDKKSGAPNEEKAKPKKEEKSEPSSLDEVMLADKAKPRPAAPEPKPEAAKPSGNTATDIDQLLGAKPTKQPAKSRSLDDLLEGADKDKNPGKAAAPAPAPAPATAAVATGNDADSDLPDAPSRDEILAAMHGVEPSVRACAIGQQITGTAEAAITISGSSGRVTTANIGGITGNVGSCIARAVRNAKFSRFKKPTFSIKYPYRF